MISGKSVLGLIPARGGSKRVPGKNLREFNHPEFGKLSLLEIAIRVAGQSKYIDRIIVSSDSDEILKLAQESQRLTRQPFLASDSATSEAVIAHAIYVDWQRHKMLADYFVLLQPTSPLRTAADIDFCLEIVHLNPSLSVVSHDQSGARNGAVYACTASSFLETLGFQNIHEYTMPSNRSLDIDTEADFQ